MTASAKLKSSARTFVTPASMPVDIRSTRTRKSPEGQAESLHGANQCSAFHAEFGNILCAGCRRSSFGYVCNQNEHASNSMVPVWSMTSSSVISGDDGPCP